MMFKLQPPANLISRLFILEYMREIDTQVLYDASNPHQQKVLFYKFTNDEGKESIDLNWEYWLFKSTLPELENFISKFMKEVSAIEESRKDFYKQELVKHEEQQKVTDINIMDMAQTEINKNKPSGFQLN